MSLVLRTAGGEVLVAGDAIYVRANLNETHLPHRSEDEHLYRRSLREIQQYVRETPDALVIPGHDWGAWQGLDASY
jgi:N-acyl homoserine lactone hydrolase